MLFTSYGFIAFLFLVVVLYYLVPGKLKLILLLAAGLGFCATYDPRYLIFLLTTAITVWGAALLIEKDGKKFQFIFVLTLLFNLGILAVTKYTNFAIDTLNFLFFRSEGRTPVPFLNILVPLGISFYTFQAVAYLIDVHRGDIKAERNFLHFALYVSFFPTLVQGPIGRYHTLALSLLTPHRFDTHVVARGFVRVIYGFFKKLVIADRLAIAVNTLAEGTGEYPGGYVLLRMLLFTLQLYMDFSGGIDMTIGIAEMMGIRLDENFKRPFFSNSLAEYWRRWHITMGTWFRDYIFYPVSSSDAIYKLTKRVKKTFGPKAGKAISKRIPLYIGTFLVWLATGIWHGARWNFVVWGLLNFVFLMISQEFHPLTAKMHKKMPFMDGPVYGIFMKIRTFLLVCVLNFFICPETLREVTDCFASVFSKNDWARMGSIPVSSLGLTVFDVIVLGVSFAVVFAVSLIQEITKEDIRTHMKKWAYPVKAVAVITLVLVVLLFGVYGIGFDATQFIYNRY
ncbi:MAG: MBOAT family protein [Lachnospiraceae bacterium]|nr:MBOAT family protein [Lachnospiraceae bacterium]